MNYFITYNTRHDYRKVTKIGGFLHVRAHTYATGLGITLKAFVWALKFHDLLAFTSEFHFHSTGNLISWLNSCFAGATICPGISDLVSCWFFCIILNTCRAPSNFICFYLECRFHFIFTLVISDSPVALWFSMRNGERKEHDIPK